jgi:undecaprenyl-diphosphatase
VDVVQAAVLGVVQGLTEFLPISSDGHLALVYKAFGEKPDLSFEILLHAATLIAMIVYFRHDIARLLSALSPAHKDRTADRRLLVLIVLGTVVSGVVALTLSDVVEPLSESLVWVGMFFLATAALLAAAEIVYARVTRLDDPSRMSWPRAGMVGLLQGLAVLPGLSRSGSTISAGVFAGLEREQAARFTILLGIPIITLAVGKDFVDLLGGDTRLPGLLVSAVGFAAAGLAGYAAIWWLLPFLKTHRLWGFAAYTAILGSIVLVVGLRGVA